MKIESRGTLHLVQLTFCGSLGGAVISSEESSLPALILSPFRSPPSMRCTLIGLTVHVLRLQLLACVQPLLVSSF